jgi:hypothetical protein
MQIRKGYQTIWKSEIKVSDGITDFNDGKQPSNGIILGAGFAATVSLSTYQLQKSKILHLLLQTLLASHQSNP